MLSKRIVLLLLVITLLVAATLAYQYELEDEEFEDDAEIEFYEGEEEEEEDADVLQLNAQQLQRLLVRPNAWAYMKQIATKYHTEENMNFAEAVIAYEKQVLARSLTHAQAVAVCNQIYNRFIAANAPEQINLPGGGFGHFHRLQQTNWPNAHTTNIFNDVKIYAIEQLIGLLTHRNFNQAEQARLEQLLA